MSSRTTATSARQSTSGGPSTRHPGTNLAGINGDATGNGGSRPKTRRDDECEVRNDGVEAKPKARGGAFPAVWGSRLIRLASVLAAVAAWQFLTADNIRLWVRFDTLPTVTEIVRAFRHQLGTDTFYLDLGQSLIRILTGFGLAAILGVTLGVALGRSRWAADTIGPLTELARPIPAIAVVPVAILLFPDDEAGIVFITFLAAFFPVMVSTRHAVRALPTIWEDSVRTLGGSRRDVLLRVVLPGSLPGVFSGLSVGIGVAWICVVSAEMISGRLGVGYRTWQAYTIVDYPGVFVGIITIGVLGYGTSAAVELIGRRVTHWLPRVPEVTR